MNQGSSMSSRREFLTICGGVGIVSSFFVGALYALATTSASEPISPEIIDQAAELAGITILPEQKQAMLSQLRDQRNSIVKVRAIHLPNDVPPAFRFDPLLGLDSRCGSDIRIERAAKAISPTPAIASQLIPSNLEELAFATVRELGELIRQRKVSSVALTEMYLARLNRFDPKLHFTITLTEERAKAQARAADEEIAKGNYRGPLHGIPWGAKDILAVRGYPTTWGAGGFQNQSIDEDATVVRRLDEAGAILVAKLTSGALAMGDKWFGGRTRNPWNLAQGSADRRQGQRRPLLLAVSPLLSVPRLLVPYHLRRPAAVRPVIGRHLDLCRAPVPWAGLDNGQAGTNLPGGRGLRACDASDLRCR
jgi:hypothetical protein